MDASDPPAGSAAPRHLLLAVGVAVLLAVGGFVLYGVLGPDAPEETAVEAPPAPPPAPAVEETPAAGDAPDVASFDVVQVDPTGTVVVAGRTAPTAAVRLRVDGTAVAEETADARGEFVFHPDDPLAPGVRELSLAVDTPVGERVAAKTVVVSIPERGGGPAVAMLVDSEGTPLRVLQGAGASDGPLVLETVTRGPDGSLVATGRGDAGNAITLYLDDEPVSSGRVDGDGSWRIDTDPVPPGTYALRLDQSDLEGRVVARIASTFVNPDPANIGAVNPASRVVLVRPGQSLWAIAREVYGQGLLYTLIYDSNDYQIIDPDLIYPGQLFIVPDDG